MSVLSFAPLVGCRQNEHTLRQPTAVIPPPRKLSCHTFAQLPVGRESRQLSLVSIAKCFTLFYNQQVMNDMLQVSYKYYNVGLISFTCNVWTQTQKHVLHERCATELWHCKGRGGRIANR